MQYVRFRQFGGAEKSQGRHFVFQTHSFATFFKVPVEAHEAKEKETKEQGSDASQKR